MATVNGLTVDVLAMHRVMRVLYSSTAPLQQPHLTTHNQFNPTNQPPNLCHFLPMRGQT